MAPDSSAGRARWLTGLPRGTAASLAFGVGFVAFLWAAFVLGLLMDNNYGLVGDYGWAYDHSFLVGLTWLGGALGWALLLARATRLAALRSRALAALLIGSLVGTAWVLTPRKIDVYESWVAEPNARWACDGWTFRHYPPGHMDDSVTVWCVGLETRIPDG